MSERRWPAAVLVLSLWLMLDTAGSALAEAASQISKSRIEAALQNITTLVRPGQDGFATMWDGNKYVQCRRQRDRSLRCEAAGTLMQPSLEHVLTPERMSKLKELGWSLDPRFGNYVQIFPPDAFSDLVADKIMQVLADAYGADLDHLQIESTWVKSERCPPRNGPTQNLAGMINNAPAMAATAVHACAYIPKSDQGPARAASTVAELISVYGDRVTGEIQRLRVNIDRHIFAVFQAGIGYVQCTPDSPPPAIYCEAQSADSWEALASILTPERVARLHAAGFADPGRAPNYWKKYSAEQFDDSSIAHEVLSILYDVYGYNGLPKLEVITEESGR